MISALTIGNHVATTYGGANGNWELNLYKPLIFNNTLRSCRLLGQVCKAFTKNCLAGAEPDKAKIELMLSDSLMNVTALSPHIGYDKVTLSYKTVLPGTTSLPTDCWPYFPFSPDRTENLEMM